jgi:hypothetical protein
MLSGWLAGRLTVKKPSKTVDFFAPNQEKFFDPIALSVPHTLIFKISNCPI